MKDLLKKIYQDILLYEAEVVEKNKKAEMLREKMLQSYESRMSDEELELLGNEVAEIMQVAQSAGFETGVQFVLRLIISGYSD